MEGESKLLEVVLSEDRFRSFGTFSLIKSNFPFDGFLISGDFRMRERLMLPGSVARLANP
jgi:hypothetical protein